MTAVPNVSEPSAALSDPASTAATASARASLQAFAHLRTRTKLCGLRTGDDVRAAVAAGADAVGFVLYPPSPRAVDVSQTARLAALLPPWVTPVALFVNPSVDEVNAALAAMPRLTLQFHADEDNAFCRQFGAPFIKAARMHAGLNLVEFAQSYPDASAILVDALVQGYGGGGHAFDWSWLPQPGQLTQPLILSGGLTVDNVAQAIASVQPYAVDVSSGIERSRGQKCPQQMAAFCRAVAAADAGSRVS